MLGELMDAQARHSSKESVSFLFLFTGARLIWKLVSPRRTRLTSRASRTRYWSLALRGFAGLVVAASPPLLLFRTERRPTTVRIRGFHEQQGERRCRVQLARSSPLDSSMRLAIQNHFFFRPLRELSFLSLFLFLVVARSTL